MPFDPNHFTDTLRAGLALADAAAAESADGGTCNFDSCVLRLPRVPESKVVAAVAEAGYPNRVYRTDWLGSGYFLSGPGQADKRTRWMETLRKHLRAAGYTVDGYYQMD